MSSNRRTSTMPPAPKPPTSFSSSLVIAENASLTGSHPINIGSNTVIHPRTKLSSAHAPITIGSSCIISERSMIGYQSALHNERDGGVQIGNGVTIETGAVVEAKNVGDGCVIEVNARIGKHAILGKHCKIGAMCEVAAEEVIPDCTVIYGNGLRRIDKSGIEDLKLKMAVRQVDVLRKLIPSNAAKFQ